MESVINLSIIGTKTENWVKNIELEELFLYSYYIVYFKLAANVRMCVHPSLCDVNYI